MGYEELRLKLAWNIVPKPKQATTESLWVKKHFFLWDGSSCSGADSVFIHVTESGDWIQFSRHFVLWGFLERVEKYLKFGRTDLFLSVLLKWFHKACWPDWEDQRSYSWSRAGRTWLGKNHRGVWKEVGFTFTCFQLLPLFRTYYCSHSVTNLTLSKETWRNRSSSSTQHGTKGLKSHNSIVLDGSFYFLLVHLPLKRIHTLFLP